MSSREEGSIQIRNAQLADAEAIAEVENLAYRDLDPEHRMEGHAPQTAERVRTAMARNNERGVVVPHGDGLRAIAIWRPCGDPVATSHLHLLFIHPDFQRAGLGARLLRLHWEQSLAEWPTFQLFTLNTLRESYWSLSFYAKHGYHIYAQGDEGQVPGLSQYLAVPPSPGRPARAPYFALHYLPAEDARKRLTQGP